MSEDQLKKAASFLGVRVLTPLESTKVVGGMLPIRGGDYDDDDGEVHRHQHPQA